MIFAWCSGFTSVLGREGREVKGALGGATSNGFVCVCPASALVPL